MGSRRHRHGTYRIIRLKSGRARGYLAGMSLRLAILAGLALASCSKQPDPAQHTEALTVTDVRSGPVEHAEAVMRELVKRRAFIKTDRDIEFREVYEVPAADIVCGKVRWRLSTGPQSEFATFHVVAGQAEFEPSPPLVPGSGLPTEATDSFATRHAPCAQHSGNIRQ